MEIAKQVIKCNQLVTKCNRLKRGIMVERIFNIVIEKVEDDKDYTIHSRQIQWV